MILIIKGAFLLAFLTQLFMNVMSDCDNLPVIKDSTNNATDTGPYAEGYVVSFSCNMGYSGEGNRHYTCTGGSFVSTSNYTCYRTCGRHDNPKNGKIVGIPRYREGTTIEFSCNNGYTMQGSSTLLCRSNGDWRPLSAPTCNPVDCGNFGGITNAERVFQVNPDGVLNDYRSEVHITCEEGYVLNGSPRVVCEASGVWGPKPTCDRSDCGQHPVLNSSCIGDSSLSDDGSVLTIICLESEGNVSVTETGSGSGTAFCFDNEWDELDMACMCDCLVNKSIEGVDYSGLLRDKFVRHGGRLNWACRSGYLKKIQNAITCNDGVMEQPACTKIPDTTKRPHTTNGGKSDPHGGNETTTIDPRPDVKCETENYTAIVICFIVSAVHVIVCLYYSISWYLKKDQEKKYDNFAWWYWVLMAIGLIIAIILFALAGHLVQWCKYLEIVHQKEGKPFETWQWVVIIFGILGVVGLDVAIIVIIEKFTGNDNNDKKQPSRNTGEETVPLDHARNNGEKSVPV